MTKYIIGVPTALKPESFSKLSVAEKKILCAAFEHSLEVSEIEPLGVEIMLGAEEHKRLDAAGVKLFATIMKT